MKSLVPRRAGSKLSLIPWSRGGLDVDREIRVIKHSAAMAQSSTKRSAAQGEQASGRVQGQPTHLVWQLALGFGEGRSPAHEPQQRGITNRDDRASAIAILYQTCKTWRKQLSDDGFCMRTFSLCRALADGNSPQTLQRVQATIGRQLERTSDQVETDQAWWRPSYPAM